MARPFQTIPLYLQVRDVLADNIVNGLWPPNALIPGEVSLAHQYGVSVGTIRKALAELETDGLLTRAQGRGTSVVEPNSAAIRARFEPLVGPDREPIALSIRQLSGEVCEASGLNSHSLNGRDGEVILCRQVGDFDGRTIVYREARIPAHVFPEALQAKTWDLFQAASAQGLWITRAAETISVTSLPQVAARAMHLKPSLPVLLIERTTFARDDTVLERRSSWCDLPANVAYRSRTR